MSIKQAVQLDRLDERITALEKALEAIIEQLAAFDVLLPKPEGQPEQGTADSTPQISSSSGSGAEAPQLKISQVG